MALSLTTILLILAAFVCLILISVFTMFDKKKLAVALAVLEAFLVASATYFG